MYLILGPVLSLSTKGCWILNTQVYLSKKKKKQKVRMNKTFCTNKQIRENTLKRSVFFKSYVLREIP